MFLCMHVFSLKNRKELNRRKKCGRQVVGKKKIVLKTSAQPNLIQVYSYPLNTFIESMWPFTKSSNTDDSLDDLPSDLQKVLEQEIRQDSNKFELDKYSRIVNDKLNQLPPQFTNEQEFLDFENYKIQNNHQIVAQINCAEIENYLIQLNNNHSISQFWSSLFNSATTNANSSENNVTTNPNQALQNYKSCKNLTIDGLKLLYYSKCYNIKQCQFIRYHLDQLYIKNFGSLGQNVNDKNIESYYKDLDQLFYKVWK